jgi:hypothetical protein
MSLQWKLNQVFEWALFENGWPEFDSREKKRPLWLVSIGSWAQVCSKPVRLHISFWDSMKTGNEAHRIYWVGSNIFLCLRSPGFESRLLPPQAITEPRGLLRSFQKSDDQLYHICPYARPSVCQYGRTRIFMKSNVLKFFENLWRNFKLN